MSILVIGAAIIGFLVFAALSAGLRGLILNPKIALVLIALLVIGNQYGNRKLANDTELLTIQPLGSITGCPEPNSLRVRIRNEDARAIIGFSFSLYGVRPNYSDSVVQAFHRSDRIVTAGTEWTTCWEIKRLEDIPVAWRSSLVWSAQFDRVDFAE